jgi:phosphate transport system substrate-binding protein
VSIGYDAVGSGEGVKRFIAREVDFAGSDEILTESEAAKLDASVLDPAASGAYPITTYSWMFLYPRHADPVKGKAMRDYAEWVLSQQAQNYGAQLGYLPLSADVTALGREALAGLAY